MIKKRSRNEMRIIRHRRLRKTLKGSLECPRMAVFSSLSNIYVQLIDDNEGHTLVAASTLDKELKTGIKSGSNVEAAKAVGSLVARMALDKGINSVVFDRGGHTYHGRVKALAEAAREAGLKF